MNRSRLFLQIEPVEPRMLFSGTWGPTATLVDQGAAVSQFPTINGKGIAVAMIDSGIDYNLPELGGGFGPGHKVEAGWDFVDNDADPMDTDGHGTETAGVVAANPFVYNGMTYAGVAPAANLIALRVTDGVNGAADSTIQAALDWVLANYQTYNIRVVNISLGSGAYTTDQNNGFLSADFATLASKNIAVIAASGNSGDSVSGGVGIAYPAADANVFSVGAVDASDQITSFSQRGSLLDLLAPGQAVPSTQLTGAIAAVDGTSFSSPYTAGTAALLFQDDSTLTVKEAESILRASGKNNFDGDSETGNTTGLTYPRLDILNAIELTNARKVSAKNSVGTTGAAASDIAYDQDGVLNLAYYDGKTIRFATRDSSGLWSATQIVDTSGDNVGIYLSIAIDPTGKPGIAYFDMTTADLKYAHFNGATWDVRTLDSNKNVGAFPSIAFDQAGDPEISYYRKSGGDLKLATANTAGVWSTQTIDSTDDVGAWTSIATDNSAGIVAISYADVTNGDLKYARYLDGAWTIFTVDNLNGVGYTSLNIHNDQAFIAYQDMANGDLKFAMRENSQWMTETVYTPGSTGQFANLVFDSNNAAHIVFWSKSKNLTYQAVGSFGSWTIHKVGTGGAYVAAATTDDDDVLSFVSLDNSKRTLEFGALI